MRDLNQNAFSGFARKIGIVSLMAICFALLSASASAQTVLVNYDFSSAVASVGTAPCNTGTPLTTATGVTSTFTVGGTGVCTTPAGIASTVPPAFVANALNQSVSITGFLNTGTTNFFQFQLSGVSSYQDFMLFFQAQRSSTGPVNADIQYSLDGTNFTTFQTIAVPTAFAPFNIDLSTVAAIERQPTVYFRIFGRDGTGASGTGGTFRIDNFQVQAALAPTAATVNVGGRVTNSKNRGIARATVSMTDGSGNRFVAYTNSFGYYRFDDVEVGQTLIFDVRAKGYNFTQPTQLVSLNEEATTIDFKAYESRAF